MKAYAARQKRRQRTQPPTAGEPDRGPRVCVGFSALCGAWCGKPRADAMACDRCAVVDCDFRGDP